MKRGSFPSDNYFYRQNGKCYKNENCVGVRRGERIPLMHLTQISFKGFLLRGREDYGSCRTDSRRMNFFLGVFLPSLYLLLKDPGFKPRTGRGESDCQSSSIDGKQRSAEQILFCLSMMINNDRSAISFRARP